MITSERLALLALDRELATLQASSRTAFFNAIAVMHEALWPPPPFEPAAFEWAARHLQHDPSGEGWYGWVMLANGGERSYARRRAASIRLSDLERYGSALLVDQQLEDGRHLLVWTE